jgi:hypothetical protein
MYKISAIAWTIAVLLFTTPSALSIVGGTDAGKLALTAEQYGAVVGGKIDFLPAVQIGKHEYSAVQSELDRYNIKPLAEFSDLYEEFMDQNRATFQSWANKNCRDYFGIWCCPYGGCSFFYCKTI